MTAVPAPRPTWTWAQSWWLELRAYGWLVGVTAPMMTVLTLAGFWGYGAAAGPASGIIAEPAVEAVPGMLLGVLFIDLVTAVFAIGGMLVALPFTMLLGRLTVSIRSRVAHVALTALLAGTVAALCVCWADTWITAPLAVAAGAAGALGRHGEFRRADRLAARSREDAHTAGEASA